MVDILALGGVGDNYLDVKLVNALPSFAGKCRDQFTLHGLAISRSKTLPPFFKQSRYSNQALSLLTAIADQIFVLAARLLNNRDVEQSLLVYLVSKASCRRICTASYAL